MQPNTPEPCDITYALRQLVGTINVLADSIQDIAVSQKEQVKLLKNILGTLNVKVL